MLVCAHTTYPVHVLYRLVPGVEVCMHRCAPTYIPRTMHGWCMCRICGHMVNSHISTSYTHPTCCVVVCRGVRIVHIHSVCGIARICCMYTYVAHVVYRVLHGTSGWVVHMRILRIWHPSREHHIARVWSTHAYAPYVLPCMEHCRRV